MDYTTYKRWDFMKIGNNKLLVQENFDDGSFKKKAVFVEDCPEYTYKLMKTKILAYGGASGLYEYMKKCVDDNFCTVLVEKILSHACNIMRAC